LKLPKVKIVRHRPDWLKLPEPEKPRITDSEDAENLTGIVQDLKASAPEERFARALSKLKSIDGYSFRETVGAPRNLPGFKEIDFTIYRGGIVYALECDTLFTHAQKERADVLHDAIILNELKRMGLEVYPQVIHLAGDTELADQDNADRTARRLFE